MVGGRTSDGQFMSDMYSVTFNSMREADWQRVNSHGGREADHRLTGHSTVYHMDSRSLLVFGGFSPENARFPRRSALLLCYHIDAGRWTTLSYDTSVPAVPRERAYHAAVVVGHYMLVHGGQVHVHHEDETCYDSQIYVYHLTCHVWVDFVSLTERYNGLFTDPSLVFMSFCEFYFIIIKSQLNCACYITCKDQWYITSNGDDELMIRIMITMIIMI